MNTIQQNEHSFRASSQTGDHPRPQLLRPRWTDLSGPWGFANDPDDAGIDAAWWTAVTSNNDQSSSHEDLFDQIITVPFPPESAASGVGDPRPQRVIWYRRQLTQDDLEQAGLGTQGDRLVLRFGAVDYIADVWLDGQYLGQHVGGQTPFSFDLTPVLLARTRHGRNDQPLTLVLRAEDDPTDVSQPRGKQDWRDEPHVIWYDRTTGIWQPVWLEAVPSLHFASITWEADISDGSVLLAARLSTPLPKDATVRLEVTLRLGDEVLAEQVVQVMTRDIRSRIDLPRQANGQQYEEILWSPEQPTLIDATLRLRSEPASGSRNLNDPRSSQPDVVASYLGLRSIEVTKGQMLLNGRPFYLRSVLEQGFWPQSHLAPPSAEALRAEVQLIKDIGFNSTRIHQKAEDPRFLYWCDRLGLTVWAETANAYAFSPRSVELLTHEWLELVRRDRSHPSIITWVPLNESWGAQHGAHDTRQQHYSLGLSHLTKALDATRPVISNDGWEHTDSDIWTIHDYTPHGDVIRARYSSAEAVAELLDGIGPAGRRMRLNDGAPLNERGQPVMLTEFGGISYASDREDAWGYSTATDEDDFANRLADLLEAVHQSPSLAGFCWTQLTDTGQETNGLLHADRSPKLPIEVMRRMVTGETADQTPQRG